MPARRAKKSKRALETGAMLRSEQPVKRPVRIGFVLTSFTYGGAEHDVIQLITESDPRVLEVVGMAIETPFPICPDLPLDHPRVPRIFQPQPVTRHPKIVGSPSFAAAVKAVAGRADVLVTWGVANLADVIPRDFRGRIVATSKASGRYQESFLHANALLTSDYVANSVKSAEAFPAAVRHRAHVIYPGVDPRRIECTRDQAAQRALWRLRPTDRIVGYLGRIAPDKGVEQLAEAVSLMAGDWKAVFVGRNGNFSQYEQSFARLCRRLLPGRHRIVPWTTEVGNAINAFDVLAYATEEEGFANTLAEAWLLGIPTVSRAGVGALAESYWAGCSTTIPLDFTSRQLARSLIASQRNRQVTDRARRRAQTLTVENTIDQWQRYFTQLVDRPRRTRVMVLLTNLVMGGIPSWLLTLMRHTPEIDWCCLCIVSETTHYAVDLGMANSILHEGCPIVAVPPVSARETKQRVLRTIRQTRPDVLLQSGVKRLDERLPNIDLPLITVSHGPADSDWAREVLAWSSQRATHRVAISTTSRNAFPKGMRKGTRIIKNGVPIPDLKELSPAARRAAKREMGFAEREIAVGFVGRLSPEKNPLSVARAAACLPKNYRVVFIGPDCANLLPTLRTISPGSIHLGSVSPLTMRKLLPGLDVLVCTSDFESFGLAIVEAWAAQVPVVSTRVGIVAEHIGALDVAVTIPVDPSPAELSDAVQRACRERKKRIQLCRTLAAQEYDARRMGCQWQEFLIAAAGINSPAVAKEAS